MARVLIVDDSEFALDFTQEMLEELGHQVTATTDPHEFLRLIAANRPEIGIVDSVMPDIDGPEVVRRVRNHSQPEVADIPLIIASALDEPPPNLPRVWLLPKPFAVDELETAINQAISTD